MTMRFAANHMLAPRLAIGPFFDLASGLGLADVEIRNDLSDCAILDGTPASDIKRDAAAHGLTILSINALQRFNQWNAERAAQAGDLIAYAQQCGAKALVMCPVNDIGFSPGKAERLAGLRQALEALAPMLRHAGLIGLVEPLGFVECSLRLKSEAVEAISAVEASDVFQLVHDTFHHHVAGETEMFPRQTGLVHISGVSDAAVPTSSMRDPHRVLVDAADRIDNVGQIRDLVEGGYAGPFSFEPFAESVASLEDPRSATKASINYIETALGTRAV